MLAARQKKNRKVCIYILYENVVSGILMNVNRSYSVHLSRSSWVEAGREWEKLGELQEGRIST